MASLGIINCSRRCSPMFIVSLSRSRAVIGPRSYAKIFPEWDMPYPKSLDDRACDSKRNIIGIPEISYSRARAIKIPAEARGVRVRKVDLKHPHRLRFARARGCCWSSDICRWGSSKPVCLYPRGFARYIQFPSKGSSMLFVVQDRRRGFLNWVARTMSSCGLHI